MDFIVVGSLLKRPNDKLMTIDQYLTRLSQRQISSRLRMTVNQSHYYQTISA